MKSLLAILKGSSYPSPNSQQQHRSEKSYTSKPCQNRLNVNNLNAEIASTLTRNMRQRSKSPPLRRINQRGVQASYHNSTPTSSSTMPLMSPFPCDICYNPTRVSTKWPLLASHTQLALAQSQKTSRNAPSRQPSYKNGCSPNH